ncbi:hypothetical protein J2S74_004449 [Evansella vedderi]|uniref:Uncharacterized protein n=1 Tax=Evansella vedderi TaxID=38282 RepID=A0ABU0A1L4_9BACI|nr:hypothetical protein [Evansella vedderi]MDQ0257004.1 hypothetical protein [Evansella vedderi]
MNKSAMRLPIEAATRALPIRTENALIDKKRFFAFYSGRNFLEQMAHEARRLFSYCYPHSEKI